jgi:electron transfer flavoprotein beta subunit
MEAGKNEIFRLKLPSVLEVQAGINHPRYASLKGIMQAKRKEIASLSRAELGLAENESGAAGSRVEILGVDFPRAGAGARILEGDVATTTSKLVELLRAEARVL